MTDRLPDEPMFFVDPHWRHTLPRDTKWLLKEHVGRPILELYGPSGAGNSLAAAKVVRAADRKGRVAARWVPVLRCDTAPELVLLRLLETLGATPEPLFGMLLAAPDDLAPMLTALCREQLMLRSVVVLDGVPRGEPGIALLRLVARTLQGTNSRAVATSRSRHAVPGLRLTSHRVWTRPRFDERYEEARTRRGGTARSLLDALGRWQGEEFTVPVATALCSVDCREAVRSLHIDGLLQQPWPGRYRLHPALRPETHPESDASQEAESAASLDTALARTVIEGHADVREGTDAYADLALRLLCRRAPEAPALMGVLEPHLTGKRGLFRLLRLKQSLWHATGDWEPVRILAAVSARETGNPLQASHALKPQRSPRAALEDAVTQHHTGRLAVAATALDEIPADVPNGWVLHTRAAILCDMGDLQGADRLLRRAVEAHQVKGDPRGEAWAVHHYGRLRLLRGDPEEARKRLETALHMFIGIGDLRGEAWVKTELGRVQLFGGACEEAIEGLRAARALHKSNRDVRGAAWTLLYTGLARVDLGRPERAKDVFTQAFMEFRGIPDLLGAAWAEHFLGILPWFGGEAPWSNAELFLRRAHTDFNALGCPHGLAWSTLELAEFRRHARTRPRQALDEEYGAARVEFEAIDDRAGEQWVASARYADAPASLAFPRRKSRQLSDFYPPHVLRDYTQAPDAAIPFAARYTIPERGVHVGRGTPAAAESHVRLLLLDNDKATTGTASRIALHITPGPDHPWSTPAAVLPWLTARATPLTAADIEPVHAVTLKPSPPDPDGAEFLFTPRRAGRHRLLLTIEDSATATVLQQVETYIDVTDGEHGAPDDALSPEALRRA
ncbi:tetratricopeptide repeat protein [Streptomyces lasiicapitis]|uniref:Tetratricopeptide repeat protein n=1 Tax=Streptomyces lasiicapitis TaxID=1923961 RepID=A0ABQ2LHY7_9ACTN|nr:tetratricopeptide repeat protein [Streptomyces lasiicapitis]GGO34919.1 hypothetical protein GCM10012286_04760 [Streptomyces lasiicapitis]